jgi:hypothetical protein
MAARRVLASPWFAFPHQALDNRTPMAVWCEGTIGALGERAVDMMDNGRALPTWPQPQQQQQQLSAARSTDRSGRESN